MKNSCRPLEETRAQLEAVNQEIGLTLRLHWLGDRYGQRIFANFRGTETLIAETVEDRQRQGAGGFHAFQDLSHQVMEDRELIFLVGSADGDYWSSSIDLLPSGCGFEWDLSCKPSAAKTLQMQFHLLRPIHRFTEESVSMVLDPDWECAFQFQPITTQDSRFIRESDFLTISTHSAAGSAKTPVRWKLRVELRKIASSLGG